MIMNTSGTFPPNLWRSSELTIASESKERGQEHHVHVGATIAQPLSIGWGAHLLTLRCVPRRRNLGSSQQSQRCFRLRSNPWRTKRHHSDPSVKRGWGPCNQSCSTRCLHPQTSTAPLRTRNSERLGEQCTENQPVIARVTV
jgi:hypothetical protein